MMRFYTQQHRFYCGVDLHARTISLCVLDAAGLVAHRATIDATPAAVLAALTPFRDGLVVGCECMFAWYWLADLCQSEQIPFVLGHALYLKLIHGGKSKNDTIDAHKLATLLRGGAFPQAYGAMPSPRVPADPSICVWCRALATSPAQPVFDVLSIAPTPFRRIRRICPRPRCRY